MQKAGLAPRLSYVLLCRRFAAALAGDSARLEVDVDRYSFIVSDLHRLLIAGLPAHCERFWTLPYGGGAAGINQAATRGAREDRDAALNLARVARVDWHHHHSDLLALQHPVMRRHHE
jgi:hypothetical protein